MLGYVYTFDDLTEIRRLEREVRMQDRLAAVGRLAAAIAHEIRNPLTSIAGSVSMLSGIAELSDEQRQLLQIVTRESERLNDIITDFLAYSRGKQYRFDRVDLLPLLEDTLTLLEHRLVAQNTGIHIERSFRVKQAWRAGRWRQDQAGLLELLRERGARHEKRRHADRLAGSSRRRLADQFRRHRSRHEPATGRRKSSSRSSRSSRAAQGWAWPSCTRSCRRTKAKCGRVPSWARAATFVLRLRRLAAAGVGSTARTSAEVAAAELSQGRTRAAAAAGMGGAHG